MRGRPNSDVLKPWANGNDVTGRPSDKWIIDFGVDLTEGEALEAVAAAYGWPADLSDEEVLERLFKLNQERAAAQSAQSSLLDHAKTEGSFGFRPSPE